MTTITTTDPTTFVQIVICKNPQTTVNKWRKASNPKEIRAKKRKEKTNSSYLTEQEIERLRHLMSSENKNKADSANN